ncbi:putative RNA recognition motif domain, nucleotide-binding alpha-beta plait domain superfamily [Helianthus annuus]|nr:putative RNA recognition motif domain, nucleotide-binding alpha-beta plait domain superfamily [Helianthus annuus]
MAVRTSKFYVANIPDGCRPWDLATFLGNYGEIVGSFIARKRSKDGLKFGFVSFNGVKDWKEMERNLQGLSLGGFKLKINIARYAKENDMGEESRFPATKPHTDSRKDVMDKEGHRKEAFFRSGCSYSAALMNNIGTNSNLDDSKLGMGKIVEVHSETSAFFDMQGRVVVGRAKDVDSLINLKVNLISAGIKGFKLFYLGGLNMMISLKDEIDASTLAYERLAWLKIYGVPLHLAENKVFNDTASLFGKVIKGSQLSPDDWDLSYSVVGVLVDQGARISGSASILWRKKKFKIWVSEESEDWILDCMFEEERVKKVQESEEVAGQNGGDGKEGEESSDEEEEGISARSENARDDYFEDLWIELSEGQSRAMVYQQSDQFIMAAVQVSFIVSMHGEIMLLLVPRKEGIRTIVVGTSGFLRRLIVHLLMVIILLWVGPLNNL